MRSSLIYAFLLSALTWSCLGRMVDFHPRFNWRIFFMKTLTGDLHGFLGSYDDSFPDPDAPGGYGGPKVEVGGSNWQYEFFAMRNVKDGWEPRFFTPEGKIVEYKAAIGHMRDGKQLYRVPDKVTYMRVLPTEDEGEESS